MREVSLLVAGATGAIGRCVVYEALRREEFTRIVALTRSSTLTDPADLFGLPVGNEDGNADTDSSTHLTGEQLARLQPVTFDWEAFCSFWEKRRVTGEKCSTEDESFYRNLFSGHTYVAMCLGTTRRDAGSAGAFKRCDFDYVVSFAEAVRVFSASSLNTYAQISAQVASKTSWLLYPRTKGRADAAVAALELPRLCIYRPGLLARGSKTRSMEKIASWFIAALPVELCGRAIIRDFIHCANASGGDETREGAGCAGKLEGSRCPAKIILFGNEAIKREAAALAKCTTEPL
ncbi:hypothetical protein ERJ75_000756100 [Trypanosoma vivax]|uniref:NAD(P)-binding domain-containing protein n=1 Tax=Trypanosoma vivax (strain Y486) TaxID=1055687 RepID=G0U009_TRYVY|nr:hypothetical protein TRVL_01137 [Trypanosoma vivax]KAH8613758.1 hypothetical protein ERJ75_000756100 [Trypanosoma vivax]CCC49406.1 conserved hypothetical protein [Trypanosoma vivax Y486]